MLIGLKGLELDSVYLHRKCAFPAPRMYSALASDRGQSPAFRLGGAPSNARPGSPAVLLYVGVSGQKPG